MLGHSLQQLADGNDDCIGQSDGEEQVALNEVVLDRGISPFLTNLECYCDGNFVTHVQVMRALGFGVYVYVVICKW